jgi:ketosteroid isomerase-like protein
MSRENVEAMRRTLDGWNRGDRDGWLEPFHPEVEWSSEIARRVEGSETVYRGLKEMREFWDEWRAVLDLTIEVAEIRDLGATVLAIGRIRTHGQGSGVDLDGPVAYVAEFGPDARIRKVRAYLDLHEALEALGLRE